MRVAKNLKKIQEKLPTWFRMRKDPNSIGAQFLNVMGLTLDDVQEILDYFHYNRFLPTADVEQVDIIYKATLPSTITPDMHLEFSTSVYDLWEAKNLDQFLHALPTDKLNHREIYNEHPYYIDYMRHVVYVRRPYDASKEYPEGKITMHVYDSERREIFRETLKLQIHHIWNVFDEFGLLLDTPRLYGETNAEYKKRLLDVFRHPANAAKRGLYNGIARELGLTKEVKWRDGGQDLVLNDVRIDLDSIEVDGAPWPKDLLYEDDSGRVVLLADLMYEGVERTVRYIAGVDVYELHDKRNLAFQKELYDMDGHATAMLQYYVDLINKKVPISWGQFLWGIDYWDIGTTEMSGEGCLPSFYDADISAWKAYREG